MMDPPRKGFFLQQAAVYRLKAFCVGAPRQHVYFYTLDDLALAAIAQSKPSQVRHKKPASGIPLAGLVFRRKLVPDQLFHRRLAMRLRLRNPTAVNAEPRSINVEPPSGTVDKVIPGVLVLAPVAWVNTITKVNE